MKDVVCLHCSTINEYTVVENNGQHTAWCNNCKRFIKNVPYGIPTLYIGKYKGKTIEEICRIDKGYLKWMVEKNVKVSTIVKEAIEECLKKDK